MENRFINKDFEQFVKQNADQYRMYPSEKVWKNIHYSLHTRRKWYGFGLALLLLTTGTVTWLMIDTGKKQQATAYKPAVSGQETLTTQTQEPKTPIFVTTRSNKNEKTIVPFTSAENLNDRIFAIEPISDESGMDDQSIASVLPAVNESQTTPVVNTPEQIHKATLASTRRPNPVKIGIAEQSPVKSSSPTTLSKSNIPATAASENVTIKEDAKDIYPLSIESVVNTYQHIRSRKKISWQVYFSPTISYRSLKENKAFINSTLASNNSLTYYTAISDINSLVTHKPDIGLQLGFNAGYSLSKRLKVIAGMQFNVSKYDIRAYTYNSEVATIALNTGSGTNSVSTITNYRNFSGDNASWLRNLYISASMPIGLELKLNKPGNTDLGIAATVQPTYMLGDRVYLISTDYKNYAVVPSLTRKWNFSGGLEAFAGINTGKIHWRVGPHVRYQMLSSFDSKYPVKEHLFDFGVKVGIMLKK